MKVHLLLRSPSLRAASVFGLSGVGSTLGNLGLARALPTTEYARVVLIIAFSVIVVGLAQSVGTIVNRFPIKPDWFFFRRIAVLASVIALIAIGGGRLIYGFPINLTIALAIICAGVSFNSIAMSMYQSSQRFKQSLWVSEIHNAMLLVAAVVILTFDLQTAFAVCLILATAYVLVPVIAWRKLLNEVADPDANSSRDFPWREAFPFALALLGIILLAVVERLSIPRLLGADELATFAVLAAVASSPFRMLARGVGYTMLPRLRAARSTKERRHLLTVEGAITGFVAIFCCIAVWVISPILVKWFLADKYIIGTSLIGAALFTGVGLVLNNFAGTVVRALGTNRELMRLAMCAWLSLSIAVVSLVIGSRWGLVGIIYGAGIGWYVNALASAFLAVPYLRPVNGEDNMSR